MSQPNYPLFSKKCQREQRNARGAYNFEKTKEYKLAEKWFEERKNNQNKSRSLSPSVQSPPPTKKHSNPPGLIKTTQTKSCKVCTKIPDFPLITNCCNILICNACFSIRSDLYNRCTSCNSIINEELYDLYDGLDLLIPSYEDFHYLENEFINIFDKNTFNIFDKNYSTPLLSK